MTTHQTLRIGYYIPRKEQVFKNDDFEQYSDHFSGIKNVHGRIMLMLIDYLVHYSKKFDSFSVLITRDPNILHPNGTLLGLEGYIKRSEVDVGLPPVHMNVGNNILEFCYPYKLSSYTFHTDEPRYKKQSFAIFQTFTMPFWIAIVSSLIVMVLVYYFALKRGESFGKISFHVVAVFFRQSSIVQYTTFAESLLFSSWVIGSMFIYVYFGSVISAFLAVSHYKEIKNVAQLATAVKNGECQCWADDKSADLSKLLLESNVESLRIIGENIMKNVNEYPNVFTFPTIAYVRESDIAELFLINNKIVKSFLAEEYFLEYMEGMMVRKRFCCKKIIDKFVHRLMCSGLFFKFRSDMKFLFLLPKLLEESEIDDSKKIITLSDIYLAFIILLSGYLISALVLLIEILSNDNYKPENLKKIKVRKKKEILVEEGAV